MPEKNEQSILLKTSSETCGYLSIKGDEWIIRSFYYFQSRFFFSLLFGRWFYRNAHWFVVFFCWFCHKNQYTLHGWPIHFDFFFSLALSFHCFNISSNRFFMAHQEGELCARGEWTTSMTKIVLGISMCLTSLIWTHTHSLLCFFLCRPGKFSLIYTYIHTLIAYNVHNKHLFLRLLTFFFSK